MRKPSPLLLLFFFLLILLASCSGPKEEDKAWAFHRRMEQVEKTLNGLDGTYKQSLADVMLNIQARHTKLYYAGSHSNWDLAVFEAEELEESLEEVAACYDGYDNLPIAQLQEQLFKPAIDSLLRSVKLKDAGEFKTLFSGLTNACNNCHKNASHAFVKITEPAQGGFVNQDFRSYEKK